MATAQTSARFEAVPQSVKAARHAAARWLASQAVPTDVIETAVLCLSEVVTNAIKAQTSSQCILVRIAVLADVVWFSVRDDNDALPTLCSPTSDDTSGRGLPILDLLTSAWGSVPLRRGKSVWCEVPLKAGRERQ